MHRTPAVAVTLMLVLAGCSGGEPTPGDSPTPPAPASASAAGSPSASPLPEGVSAFPFDVAAQETLRYLTNFDPAFTFMGAPSSIPYFGEANDPQWVELHSGETALVFMRPDAVFDDHGNRAGLPDDLGAWFAENPALKLNDHGTAHLAGLEGTSADLTVTSTTDSMPAFCDQPCRPLLAVGQDVYWLPNGIVVIAHVFDLADGPLVVLVDGEREAVDTALPLARQVMKSVEFLSP